MTIDKIYSLAYRIIKCFDDTEIIKAYPWEICKNVAELCQYPISGNLHFYVNASLIDMKSVMSRVLLSGACNIVLLHNHPSGNLNPSREDDNVKEKLKQACKLMEVTLRDFIIVGKGYYSYFEEGRL